MTDTDLRARVEELERIGRENDAHRMAVLTLINALVLKSPKPRAVAAQFRYLVKMVSENAPSAMDLEQIVEFRAQAEQLALAIEVLTDPTNAGPPQPLPPA